MPNHLVRFHTRVFSNTFKMSFYPSASTIHYFHPTRSQLFWSEFPILFFRGGKASGHARRRQEKLESGNFGEQLSRVLLGGRQLEDTNFYESLPHVKSVCLKKNLDEPGIQAILNLRKVLRVWVPRVSRTLEEFTGSQTTIPRSKTVQLWYSQWIPYRDKVYFLRQTQRENSE